MEYVIAFKRSVHAIKSEQLIINNGFMVKVMPLPSSLRVGCGIALRVKSIDIESIGGLLAGNSIDYEVYYNIDNKYERVV